jgi:biofilm protein TabA
MILDSLKNATHYEALHPRFKQAFEVLKQTDFSAVKAGRMEIDGDNLFINVMEMNGKTTAPFEAHKKYIDIQVPLSINEKMGWKSLENCGTPSVLYDDTKDVMFFDEQPEAMIDVAVGQFTVFFPEDAHAPSIANGFLKKLIVKIKI